MFLVGVAALIAEVFQLEFARQVVRCCTVITTLSDPISKWIEGPGSPAVSKISRTVPDHDLIARASAAAAAADEPD
ncbi:MAG: hypothetical protein NTX58_07965 [Actinobacteria bacterium]|nr:hypothetical protein [Actinomycetota bacterium]